jgi:hypothetical protein
MTDKPAEFDHLGDESVYFMTNAVTLGIACAEYLGDVLGTALAVA